MHLRAKNVGIHFPLHGKTEFSAPPSGSGKLGGIVAGAGRKQKVVALDDITFSLAEGDRLALVGHNGAGKSTLLRVLAGIYHPHVGSVECNGTVTGLFNISIGFRPEASGYRNILLKGLIAGKTSAQIRSALPEIVEFTELGPYLDMPLRTYSQGMAMRLAFAIATAFSSDILLMDEWIGAGDTHFREKVVKRMNSFVEAAHIVVIASHSAQLLRRVANKALWLESGRVRAIGAIDDVVDQYETEAKQQMKAQAEALVAGLSREHVAFELLVLETVTGAHGGLHAAGEIAWDVSATGVEAVDIIVVQPQGKRARFATGGQEGRRATGPWLRLGTELRLVVADSDVVIASIQVSDEMLCGKRATTD